MHITLTHFNRLTELHDQLALGQSDTFTVTEALTLEQAILYTQVDTGCLLSQCTVNEQEGYAVCKNDNYVSIITKGNWNEHPIARQINQAYKAFNTVHNIAGL
jgi:hypothetical protein